MKRYTSWGSDKSYRWLWMAAFKDAVWAFKTRTRNNGERGSYNEGLNNECDQIDNS